MVILRVYKYGTGFDIPDGAVYLCTQVETLTTYEYHQNGDGVANQTVRNEYVWHYFLVPVEIDRGAGVEAGNE